MSDAAPFCSPYNGFYGNCAWPAYTETMMPRAYKGIENATANESKMDFPAYLQNHSTIKHPHHNKTFSQDPDYVRSRPRDPDWPNVDTEFSPFRDGTYPSLVENGLDISKNNSLPSYVQNKSTIKYPKYTHPNTAFWQDPDYFCPSEGYTMSGQRLEQNSTLAQSTDNLPTTRMFPRSSDFVVRHRDPDWPKVDTDFSPFRDGTYPSLKDIKLVSHYDLPKPQKVHTHSTRHFLTESSVRDTLTTIRIITETIDNFRASQCSLVLSQSWGFKESKYLQHTLQDENTATTSSKSITIYDVVINTESGSSKIRGHILQLNDPLGTVMKIGYDCVKVIRDFVKNASPEKLKTFIAVQIEFILNPRNIYFVCISILYLYIVRQKLEKNPDDGEHVKLRGILRRNHNNTQVSSETNVQQCNLVDRQCKTVTLDANFCLRTFNRKITFNQPGATFDTIELVKKDVKDCVDAQSRGDQEKMMQKRVDANMLKSSKLAKIQTTDTLADRVNFDRVMPNFDTMDMLSSYDPCKKSSSGPIYTTDLKTQIRDRASTFADVRSMKKQEVFRRKAT
jgi:hypothetical protein